MPKLVWDAPGKHFYETGVDQGVLFVQNDDGTYQNGVVWNGLTQVSLNPTGAEATDLWADNIKYLSLMSAEELEATVEAYTYPDEWAACDGSVALATGLNIFQQPRKGFALCYRTKIGNDVVGSEYGYKIHIIYNAKASPSERAYETINDTPDAITFSWDITTTPVPVTGYKPTAHVEIDSTKFNTTALEAKLTSIENSLYGTDGSGQTTGTESTLLMPDDIKGIITAQ